MTRRSSSVVRSKTFATPLATKVPQSVVVIGVVVGFLAFWRYVYFFRDPHRTPPSGDNIVAPADGRVVYAREFGDQIVPIAVKRRRHIALHEVTGTAMPIRSGHIVGIYLSPWDVHV